MTHRTQPLLRVYGDMASGNCYKIALLLNHLDMAYEWQHIDIMKGESRTPAFLARNPNGRVPTLELPDGRCLAESNAILNFLASGTALLPDDPWLRALVLQWQFFEQYQHEPSIAVVRFLLAYSGEAEKHADRISEQTVNGYTALDAMERHLASRTFLVGERYSIADISLYAYTHVAHEGGFDLGSYPAIRVWLERVAAQPGHVTIDA